MNRQAGQKETEFRPETRFLNVFGLRSLVLDTPAERLGLRDPILNLGEGGGAAGVAGLGLRHQRGVEVRREPLRQFSHGIH